jgi:hypothetical protein
MDESGRVTDAVKAMTRQLYISGGSTRIASLRTMRLNMPCIVILSSTLTTNFTSRKEENLEETEINLTRASF